MKKLILSVLMSLLFVCAHRFIAIEQTVYFWSVNFVFAFLYIVWLHKLKLDELINQKKEISYGKFLQVSLSRLIPLTLLFGISLFSFARYGITIAGGIFILIVSWLIDSFSGRIFRYWERRV